MYDAAALRALPPLNRAVALALALGGRLRQRQWLYELLNRPGVNLATGAVTHEALRTALTQLQAQGWVQQDSYRAGHWQVQPAALATVYTTLLEQVDIAALRHLLAEADGYAEGSSGTGAHSRQLSQRFPTETAAFARLRLEALAGSEPELIYALTQRLPWGVSSLTDLLEVALTEVLDEPLLALLHPDLQCAQLVDATVGLISAWQAPPALPLWQCVPNYLSRYPGPASTVLRLLWAEALLLHGQGDPMAPLQPLLHDLAQAHIPGTAPASAELESARRYTQARVDALRAAQAAQAGRWAEAEQGFEAVIPVLRKLSAQRRGALSPWLSALYVLSLLAQPDAERLARALKFCLAEGGKRVPVPDHPLGLLAEAVRMRLGEVPMNERLFLPRSGAFSAGGRPVLPGAAPVDGPVMVLDFWRWLARAWLKTGQDAHPMGEDELLAGALLARRFEREGLGQLRLWLDAALALLQNREVPASFFVAAPRARWEQALDALMAIGQPEVAAGAAGADKAETRLIWALQLEADGSVSQLQPLEQRQGVRGWSKPKEVPLSRLQRSAEALSPLDARLARCIRQEGTSRQLRIDLPAALAALPGHPSVALLEAPERFVELSEGAPELDVTRDAGRLRVRLLPTVDLQNCQAVAQRWAASPAEQRELDALRAIRVVQDAPQRARLIQLSTAQRRVAQLLGPNGLELPESGAARLQEVLAGLGLHFQIHSDATPVRAAREQPADARLRAELSPLGDGLQLRLVAAPFGPDCLADGPRLVPGAGRARLVAALAGEPVGVQRDLAAEQAHLDSVLDACPMLLPPPPGAPCDWQLDDPELALALVERLPTLHALQGVDWPKGQPVKVDSSGLAQLQLRVHTRQEWLALDGELPVDEQLVLSLQQLMQLTAQRKSRFVPLGEGRYLALTQELRERLDDLAAVIEASGQKNLAQLRIPAVAAPWLQQATEGAQVEVDPAFAQRLNQLDAARRLVPAVPATLQATLRPYQEEGFEWAMRLSHAGLGACLADDMGLGKTLQALAVLLARAHLGPALVVAPTSLVGNWRAEARRFAPSLQVWVHAEGGAERAATLADLGPASVVLVSYQMLQMDQAAFAARRWATLVIDEAQAIKNAQAKRSQAVFELQADFRLALSGTPIENRLAELWSIMRACNPGLLGTLARFNERFAGPIERQRDKPAQRQLRRLIAPFILRRTKAQVLDDLPPRTELVLKVESDAAEQAHYEALRRQVLADAERSLSGDAPGQAHLNILAGLTRLRRAACDPRLVSPQLAMPGAKVQAFAELAAELVANGHKALVFSQFVDFLSLLKAPLDAAGIAYQYLDGSTPGPERMKRVDAFQAGQGELFLISLKAGGFGLNLTVADYVVIADPWWNPAAEDQASARAHRMGQQRPVTVYRLVNQGTLEEKILTLHRDKRELADLLLDGNETSHVPAADELLALMRGDDPSAAD